MNSKQQCKSVNDANVWNKQCIKKKAHTGNHTAMYPIDWEEEMCLDCDKPDYDCNCRRA